MKAPMIRAVVGIAALSIGLTGCGGDQHPAYSANIKFGVRHDPIVGPGGGKDLGEERYDPDRPGLLPIMKFDDALKSDHPYQAKLRLALAGMLKGILEKQNANFANLTDEQKRTMEDQLLNHSKQHHKEFATVLDKVLRDPGLMTDKDRNELEATLEKAFGTPARPTINTELTGIDKNEINNLKLDDATLAKGSTRYRVHCMHCHGVPGDGRGPTARWINPHPRDFRAGMFKFQSVDRSSGGIAPPSRADLMRTVRLGLEGTAMPSFNLLSEDDLESMVSYVMFLSMRGQAEVDTIKELELDAKDHVLKVADGDTIPEIVKGWAKKGFGRWVSSNKADAGIKVEAYPYTPEELAASVKRGQQIFNGVESPELRKHFSNEEAYKKVVGVKCISCHTDYGRQARFRFDEWGTLVRPNNFTNGIFRGGKRPVDIYYRIHSGIQGSEMPPFATNFKGQERFLWDLVNFVSVVSYPAMHKGMELRLEP